MQNNNVYEKANKSLFKLLFCIFFLSQCFSAKAIESSSIIKGLAIGIPVTLTSLLVYDVFNEIDDIKPKRRKNKKPHSKIAIAIKRSLSKLKPNLDKISALCLGA